MLKFYQILKYINQFFEIKLKVIKYKKNFTYCLFFKLLNLVVKFSNFI